MIGLDRFRSKKPSFEQKKLREAFGNFATGVIIVSSCRKAYFGKAAKFWQEFGEKEVFPKGFIKKYQLDYKKLAAIRGSVEKMMKNKFFDRELLKKFKNLFSDQLYGMTINSFTSVSLCPPLISFCIDNRSSNLILFKRGHYFALNILCEEQQGLATAFAKAGNIQKWQYEPFLVSEFGNPIFQESLAIIECKKHRIIEMGDHHVIIGEVVNFNSQNQPKESMPLTYWRGKYGINL